MSVSTRVGPIAGIAFALSGLAAFTISQAGPGAGSGGRAVIDFYVAHRTAALTSDYLWGVAVACFLVFGAALRGRFRVDRQSEAVAAVSLAAAAVTTAGATVWKSALLSNSTTRSSRSRAAMSRAWVIGSTPLVSTDCSRSINPKTAFSCSSVRADSSASSSIRASVAMRWTSDEVSDMRG